MTTQQDRLTGNTLWILGIWTFLIILGSSVGFLTELTPSFIVPAIIIVFLIMVVPYFKETGFKRWVTSFSLRRLTAFQAWRIFAAFIFFTYFKNGELPELFVAIAGWGDLVVGFLAALAVALPLNVMRYTAFHVIGLLDLIVAVWLGMTLMYNGIGGMENILTLPAALIIFLGVPISAAVHIFALDMMKKARVAKS